MSINFTKSTGHFSDTDVDYISISTDGITLEQLELSFQSFLKACGYHISDAPISEAWDDHEDTWDINEHVDKIIKNKKVKLNENGLIEED